MIPLGILGRRVEGSQGENVDRAMVCSFISLWKMGYHGFLYYIHLLLNTLLRYQVDVGMDCISTFESRWTVMFHHSLRSPAKYFRRSKTLLFSVAKYLEGQMSV
jgi:hypothetical protein